MGQQSVHEAKEVYNHWAVWGYSMIQIQLLNGAYVSLCHAFIGAIIEYPSAFELAFTGKK